MNRDQLRNELPEPVRRYFEEVARMEPPNDLMDTAMAEVESNPRVNRFSLLPAVATLAGAAAVVAAIVIGANLFGGSQLFGGTHSPTPSPSSRTAAYQPWNLSDVKTDTDLEAGAYYLDLETLPARINLRVPDGWWNHEAEADVQAVLVKGDGPSYVHSSNWGLAFSAVGRVRADPCDAGHILDPSLTKTVDALVAAFNSWTGYEVQVEDVSIGRFSAKRVTVRSKEPMNCTGILFTSPAGYDWDVIDMSGGGSHQVSQMTFVELGAPLVADSPGVLAIWTTDFPARTSFEIENGASPNPQAHAQDQVALHAILDSIHVTFR